MTDLVAQIERLAGQHAFEKGTQLYIQNKVEGLAINGQQISANVIGSKQYYVNLSLQGEQLDGGCSCPASEGFDFCKHCVATVLAYQDYRIELDRMLQGTPAQKVKAYIAGLNEKQAKHKLVELILADKGLIEKWGLLADISNHRVSMTDLKKRATKALPLKDLWQLAKVKAYFVQAERLLLELQEMSSLLNPNQAFSLAEHCLSRYDKILSRVDDSGGHRFEVFSIIETMFTDSFKRLEWSAEEKASFLFDLYFADYAHFEFNNIAQDFIAKDDQAIAHLLRDKLIAQIAKVGLKRRKSTQQLDSNSRTILNAIAQLYEFDHDIDKSLAWREKAADSVESYKSLIEACFRLERWEVIPSYLTQARQLANQFEHKTLDRLEQLLTNITK